MKVKLYPFQLENVNGRENKHQTNYYNCIIRWNINIMHIKIKIVIQQAHSLNKENYTIIHDYFSFMHIPFFKLNLI